jgi:hypothetical protein
MMQSFVPHPLRGELVRAAEMLLDKQANLPRNPENSQLSRLVQVASEAACADEIANYLRYQGARGRWKRSLAEDVIASIAPLLGTLGSEAERVAAWRLYATYLRRAYYYRREVNRDLERSRRREAGPARGEARGEEQARGPGSGGPPRERKRSRRRGRRSGAPAGEAGAALAEGAGEAPPLAEGAPAEGAPAEEAALHGHDELQADERHAGEAASDRGSEESSQPRDADDAELPASEEDEA